MGGWAAVVTGASKLLCVYDSRFVVLETNGGLSATRPARPVPLAFVPYVGLRSGMTEESVVSCQHSNLPRCATLLQLPQSNIAINSHSVGNVQRPASQTSSTRFLCLFSVQGIRPLMVST
jgi:hypothetical protein